MSSKQKKHSEALNIARKAAVNIQNNILELIKIAQSITNWDDFKSNVNIFSDAQDSAKNKLILESKNERKNDITKRIVDTLEGLTDNFPDKDFEITSTTLNNSTNSTSIKQSGRNVLRSALGVTLRRPWLTELKIEDLFKIESISQDEFVIQSDASVFVTIDAVYEKVIILVVT
jgi:hypothetical protein